MINRDQVRAKNALQAIERLAGVQGGFEGENAGDVLKGFPALIINNGLLATVAFAKHKKKGHLRVCEAIASHLADRNIHLLPHSVQSKEDGEKTDELLAFLTKQESEVLRLCTAEALAFLNYLRRLYSKED